MHVRQREQELRAPRVAELRPLVAERLDREAGRVDDRLVLVGVQRADRVDDRAAGARRARPRPGAARAGARAAARARQRRSGRAASTPSPEQGASTSARSKPSSSGGRSSPSASTTRDVRRRWRRRTFSSQLARPPGMHLDGGHLARELRRLPARRGAQVEHALALARADGERRELRAAALRPDRGPPRAPARRPGRRARRPGSPRPARPRSRRATSAHDRLGRLVLRPHQRERLVRAEVAPPDLRDPVGVRVPERRLGGRPLAAARRAARAIPSATRRATAFVNATARASPACAHELDRLVHRGVARRRPRRSRAGRRRAAARRARAGRACAPAGGRASRSRGRACARAAPCRTRAAARARGRARRGPRRPRCGTRGRRTRSSSKTRRTTSKAARRAGETVTAARAANSS